MAKGHNNKGRDIYTNRYTRLYTYMLKSIAWNSLDPYEKCTFIALKQRYNGSNNGAISMSIREICYEVKCRDQRAQKSLQILQKRGFIKAEQLGSFHWKTRHDGSKGRRATTWILTDESQDLPFKVLGGATKEFMKWQPDDGPNGGKKNKTTVMPVTTNGSDTNHHKNKMVATNTTNGSDTNHHNDYSSHTNGSDKHYTYNIPDTPSKIITDMED